MIFMCVEMVLATAKKCIAFTRRLIVILLLMFGVIWRNERLSEEAF